MCHANLPRLFTSAIARPKGQKWEEGQGGRRGRGTFVLSSAAALSLSIVDCGDGRTQVFILHTVPEYVLGIQGTCRKMSSVSRTPPC